MLSKDDNLTPENLNQLLVGVVPQGWESNLKFLNEKDCNPYSLRIIQKAKQMVSKGWGVDKSENRDCYLFLMDNTSTLSHGLKDQQWQQIHCVVRLPQIEGLKKKKTHYPVHCWAKKIDEKTQIILTKVKIEGKYIP